MNSLYFFTNHPVVTHAEFTDFLNADKPVSVVAREALLSCHVKAGHIVLVKPRLIISAPYGSAPKACPADPFHLAGKMSDDVVFWYQAAFGFFTCYQPWS